MADTVDSKSTARKGMPVRPRPPLPHPFQKSLLPLQAFLFTLLVCFLKNPFKIISNQADIFSQEFAMKYVPLLLCCMCISISGCTHDFNAQHMRLVDRSIQFADVQQNPSAYIGKTLIAGGVIAGVHNTGEGGVLEVVHYNLAEDNVPNRLEESDGCLLATTPEFFDTDKYRAGQLVTFIGEIKGKKLLHIDNTEYTYPVIAIKEIHAWSSAEEEEFQVPSNYDPYYWGYPGNPYKDRPIGQPMKRFE